MSAASLTKNSLLEKADEIYDDCYKPDVEIDELSEPEETVQDDASSTIEVPSIRPCVSIAASSLFSRLTTVPGCGIKS